MALSLPRFLQTPLALWTNAPAPMRASAFMLAAMVPFAAMGAFIRLASEELHILEVVFFRNALALLLFTPLILARGSRVLRTRQLRLHGARTVIGLGAMTAGFASVTMIPLADATALNFTAPLFATLLAVVLLSERIRFHRTAALLVGFVGVLIVLRPGFGEGSASGLTLGAGLAILSALLIAVSTLIVKRLTDTEPPEAIALWMVLLMAPLSLIPALWVWEWPTWTAMGWLTCLAFCGTVAHLCWTKACALAEITQIQPLEFVKLPISAAIGFWAFGETPTIWVLVGGAAIFAAAALITHREAVLARRRSATDPINR